MSEQSTDFGDIVAAMIQKKKDDVAAASAAATAEAARRLAAMQTACAPLLKALQHTKVKFPRLLLYREDSESPHFYTGNNTDITIRYQESPQLFWLHRSYIGGNERVAESSQVEDLLPKLLELLVVAVTYAEKP